MSITMQNHLRLLQGKEPLVEVPKPIVYSDREKSAAKSVLDRLLSKAAEREVSSTHCAARQVEEL